jgi:CheY-like chemotaxis protein
LGSGPEKREPAAEDQTPDTVGALTLLVVDDDPDLRLYVRQCVLGASGRIERVIEAADGVDGLAALRAEVPDVLVCDVLMPRLGGIDLCERLRADPATASMPVLLLTGGATSDEMRRRANEAGADGVLLKPFNSRSLRSAVDHVIRVRAAAMRESGPEANKVDQAEGENQ